MTAAEQAEYLTAKGWKRNGELWRIKGTGYDWEQSAAVAQQKWLDRMEARENG